jgi:hypothetical protein
MTTGLTYSQYVTQIATLAVVEETNPAFVTILPQMITYAENRIYRDLDLLQTSTSITGYALTAGNRTLTIPEGTIVVSEQINIITPVGQTNPDASAATRNSCLPTTKEYLDIVYGNNSAANRAVPTYFAPFNDNVFYFGPVPDQNYNVEIVGTIRPASLSANNTTTYLSLYFSDVMIMASMIYASGYQRNFGRANDDPQMAVTYESQYKTLLQGAAVEEARKKFEAAAWSSQSPAVVASPTRG